MKAGWVNDFRLLAVGLLRGFFDLVSWIGTIPPADLVGWTLLAMIVYLILSKRYGFHRCRWWGGVVIYTSIIFLTLPFLPEIWKTLYDYTDGRIHWVGQTCIVAIGIWLLIYLLFRKRERRLWVYAALVLLYTVYTVAIYLLQESPAERLHLAEYGFLSFLIYRSLRVDMGYRSAYLWGWVMASCLGGLDEGIQAWLPNRVGEWSDVKLNILSSGLGMIMVMLGAHKTRGQSSRTIEMTPPKNGQPGLLKTHSSVT